MSLVIGVLALQGDVSEHCHAIQSCGSKAYPIKYENDLDHIDGLIIPGGESTTIAKLSYGSINSAVSKVTKNNQTLESKISQSITSSKIKAKPEQDNSNNTIPYSSLINKIKTLGLSGLPIYGTCMGSIFLAKYIENNLNQLSMQLMDIKITRNAFGSQKHSFETTLTINCLNPPKYQAIFIRAPLIIATGQNVEVLAYLPDYINLNQDYPTKAIMVKEKNFLASVFHPELTKDYRIHEFFLDMVKK